MADRPPRETRVLGTALKNLDIQFNCPSEHSLEWYEFGSAYPTEMVCSVLYRPEQPRSLVLSAESISWFEGRPTSLREACTAWNRTCPLVFAGLPCNGNGDSHLYFLQPIPLLNERVLVGRTFGWLRLFRALVRSYLDVNRKLIRSLGPVAPEPEAMLH